MKRTLNRLVWLGLIAWVGAGFILGIAVVRARLRNPPWQITRVPPDEVIEFVLYTVHDGVLKLTAHLYELDPDADPTVRLAVRRGDDWEEVAATTVAAPDWTAVFRVEEWDASRDYAYRVSHGATAHYTGTIRQDPVDKDEIVVAAFTGNSNRDRGPRPDVLENVERLDPDLLFFSGDQVYDHHTHFESWLLFGRQFGEITRNRPTVVTPDDHDVGNRNLWGAGGAVGPGGYKDPDYVRQVERAQTSHLPDPYDPTPIERGIGVYYTSLTWGRVGFAVIEDRKFKSQVDVLDRQALVEAGVDFSREDHIKQVPDPGLLDVPEANLLGERQLAFLRHWTADWTGQDMKAILSQTPPAMTTQVHSSRRYRLAADLDSNGWPQSGRDRALREIRKGFALMISGDQHLATVVHHGVDDWEDAGYSFAVPSIVNHFRRWWRPLEPPRDVPEGELEYSGRFLDGFGNRITMEAYANPDPSRRRYNKWLAEAAGFGIVRFNKRTREITMECWPRGCDVSDPTCEQYPGWPVTIAQEENYGRQPTGYLPTLEITGSGDPVVQIIDETSGEILYTLRINGRSYRPPVFSQAPHTIKVGEGDALKVYEGVQPLAAGEQATLAVTLPEAP